MKIEGRWCANGQCRDFGKVDGGNILIHSHTERRYGCRTCRRTFSADQGTFFETVRSDRLAVIEAFALLSERNSLRAIERLTHHPHKTLLKSRNTWCPMTPPTWETCGSGVPSLCLAACGS